MLYQRSLWLALLLSVVLAGCSTTVGSRFGGTPQAKSIAVVGDQPLPATTGEPGGQVVADVAQPEPKRNSKTRISGRVVDIQGEPIANVTVRLADGATKGGKDIRATTDRSGAFTLNGLRPGSTYSLIAEGDDEKGPLTGRTQAKTSDTSVEISLLAEGATAKSSGRPSRVKQISNVEDLDSPVGDEGTKVNREDLLPPAEDAGEIDPGPPPARSGRPQLSVPQSTTGWRNSNSPKVARPQSQDGDVVASSSNDSPRRRRVTSVNSTDSDEDGPNPLPPAISTDGNSGSSESSPPRRPSARKKSMVEPSEPGDLSLIPEASRGGKADARERLARGQAETKIAAKDEPVASLEPDPESKTVAANPLTIAGAPPAMPPVNGEAVAALESPPPMGSPPASTPPVQNVASTNPASRPVFASEPQPLKPTWEAPTSNDYNPFAIVATNQPVVEQSDAASPSALLPDQASPAASPAASVTTPPVAEAPKKKWGELTVRETNKQPVIVEPTKATAPLSLAKRLRGTVENRNPSVALCSYDSRQQKLKDFRLPDLEGKPVHFQDLDADFVLLDFWGTWCSPCLDSIPHLIALQKKYGPSRLRVVGIACEEVPPEQRKAKVEEISRKLGINYAVLLSSMDGKPCPVQQALQVQAMPTMILVDRRGQVVWRNTGATPPTLERLDRVLASSMSRGETVRR